MKSKEISFTNFGQGYIDSKYTSRPHLNFVYLTGLNQGCLENIITNGIVNLAAASKTGNISNEEQRIKNKGIISTPIGDIKNTTEILEEGYVFSLSYRE